MAADVYALGVLLYSFLTGRLPVKRTAEDVAGYLRELRDKAPVPVTEANPKAPAACAALAMRLLAKAGERLPDAQEVPQLVSEAMEADKAALFLLAPPYEAHGETMFSALQSTPSKKGKAVSIGRRLTEWAGTAGELLAAQARALAAFAVPAAVVAFGLFAFLSYHAAQAEHRADHRANKAAEAEEKAAQALTDAAHAQEILAIPALHPAPSSAEIGGKMPPGVAPSLTREVFRGLKMPQKPDPHWLKPDKDGVCRNTTTGEELRPQAVIRGTCWDVGAKLPGDRTCPRDTYDPPPEVLSDKKQARLHNACFLPYWTEAGKSLEPSPQLERECS